MNAALFRIPSCGIWLTASIFFIVIIVKRELVNGRAKHSSSSSVPGLRTSRCDVDARRGETEHGSFCGREGPTTIRSRNSSIKSRALVSQNGSYHGRLEF